MIPGSNRIRYIHSDIRGPLYLEALRMQAEGEKVLRLNTGNLGAFGFRQPEAVRNALLARLDDAVPYCDVRGMPEAREAILRYHQSRGLQGVTADDIFVCNGVSEAATLLMTVLVGDGDEVLVPSPCYSLWSNNIFIGGGTPVYYRCDPENGWNPDPADVAARVTKRTKALVIINPNNPTGAVYSRETLLALTDIARKNGLLLLCDEIYDRLVYGDLDCPSPAALAPDVPCVTFNGLSKSHVICGFRCGWLVFSGPREELRALEDGVMQLASMRLCGNALTQLVIPAALGDRESTRALLQPGGRLYEQRAAALTTLAKIPGVSCVPNKAAFYIFPRVDTEMYAFDSDQELALALLHEKKLLIIPGRGFDWFEDLRLRVVMLPEAPILANAMERFGEFLQEHRR